MAFDRTNPAQLAALKSELDLDPIGMGYSSFTNDNVLAEVISDPLQNVGLETGVPPLKLEDIWVILSNEGVPPSALDLYQLLFTAFGGSFGLGSEDSPDISRLRTHIINNGPINDPGVSSAINALTRRLSRAEVLFGGLDENGSAEFVVIDGIDISAAKALP